ncbi:hypothetical protein DPQ33_03655 [Oceanidesulfovibrio indonesiensis]|uniref:Carboxypeptidase regulatory-like domain-containing protein n=1 Tax=Oceanidesulfovibrio indonesiensis TaxID=54767 RepID=A0A7M3MJ83_9BACT|nr:carboxypeptidase-like regulatory domain-containing protein [Oceanidesulfovibrio indonesiensis]TVM19465.1 hypothetical protein DPQ33_03655 [Oceanidesulfovibrio indonesiensis]
MTDPARNTLIEFIGPDESRTPFLSLEKVEDAAPGVFRVYASSRNYALRSSHSTPRRTAAQDIMRVRELLVFDGSRMERLRYPLAGQLRHRWLGNQGPSVIFPGAGGTQAWLESETVGVLEVQYITCFDRWEVQTPHPVAVVATLGDAQTSLLLDPKLPVEAGWIEAISGNWSHEDWDEKDEASDITVRVVNYCSGATVAGADVWLDGAHLRTNSEGEAVFRGVRSGSHSIRAAKAGYIDTNKDTLDNERFTI